MPVPDLSSDLSAHRRIVVVGTSACGKSTFCRHLAAALGYPHIELDALHWGPNWTPHADFASRVAEATAREAWIADGNYAQVRHLTWQRATALVWLDFSFPLVMARALRRTVWRIVSGQPLYADNRESIRGAFFDRDGIPWWVLRTFHRRQREFRRVLCLPDHAHLAVFAPRRPRDAERLLASIGVPKRLASAAATG